MPKQLSHLIQALIIFGWSLGAMAQPTPTPNATLTQYSRMHFGDFNYDTTPKPTGGGGTLVIMEQGLNSDWGPATSLTRLGAGEKTSELNFKLSITNLPNKWSYKVLTPTQDYWSMSLGGGTASNGYTAIEFHLTPIGKLNGGAWDGLIEKPDGPNNFITKDAWRWGGSCQITGNWFLADEGLYFMDAVVKVEFYGPGSDKPNNSVSLPIRYSIRIGRKAQGLALTKGNDLNFGCYMVSTGGTVTLSPKGEIKYSGVNKLSSPAHQVGTTTCTFTSPNTYSMVITLSKLLDLTYKNPAGNIFTMKVRDMKARAWDIKNNYNIGNIEEGIPQRLVLPKTGTRIDVGGSLDIDAHQEPGDYTGQYQVTVSYF